MKVTDTAQLLVVPAKAGTQRLSFRYEATSASKRRQAPAFARATNGSVHRPHSAHNIMPTKAIVDAFIATVVNGQHAEAIERFYAVNATMQENHHPPRVGRDVLVVHERAALARNRDVFTHPVDFFAIVGDRVAIHWVFDFTSLDGKKLTIDEFAYQRWESDKVVEERFFYDPAQMRPS
jgi:ketosteroid isomerase-like protein